MNQAVSAWKLCVAPMMDWTDRHCRVLHRLITTRTRLYTEMVTTGALLHGDVSRHLDFSAEEHPLALQLGGSEPDDLARCARLAEQWGYDEVNLNCGCPSERVQRGAFGACLMAEPGTRGRRREGDARRGRHPGDREAPHRHRPQRELWLRARLRRHRGRRAAAARCSSCMRAMPGSRACRPKENREVPPLRHEAVHRLKADFPALTIVVNGGIDDRRADRRAAAPCRRRDGRPPRLPRPLGDGLLGPALLRRAAAAPDRDAVEERFVDYMARLHAAGVPWGHASRHMMGLRNGLPGARRWRQVWSDPRLKAGPPHEALRLARAAATLQNLPAVT